MREIELSLRNIKLLLREKVTQLKDQVSSKNSLTRCTQVQYCFKNGFKKKIFWFALLWFPFC